MTRKDQIDLLYSTIEKDFQTIQSIFYESIKSKRLDNIVLVRIKNYLENLRSILDFLAQEVLEKYCDNQVRNFFPIIKKEESDDRIKSSISGCFPGLENIRPDIFDFFVNSQPKYDANNHWLLELNILCASNKHKVLSLQTRKEEIVNQLVLESGTTYIWTDGLVEFPTGGNTQVVLKPSGRISMGEDLSLSRRKDHFRRFGWIVEELENHKIINAPDLSNLNKDQYSLNSYLVGNFYFPDQKINALSQLEMFTTRTGKIIEELYGLLDK